MAASVKTPPAISVVMTVRNGTDYAGQCIGSVLAQSLGDFEFIIIDDGSTDATWDLITSYSDVRMRPVRQENRGIADSVNRAIALARAPLIARIDHDDVMLPDRLALQLAAFNAEPDLGLVCGTAPLLINDHDSTTSYTAPRSPTALKLRLLFDNPVVQSTVMMRKDAVLATGGYLKRPLPFPEDYHLWVRIAQAHPIRALQEPLTKYRVRPGSASYGNTLAADNVEVSALSLEGYLKNACSPDDCLNLARLFHRFRGSDQLELSKALAMLNAAANMIGGQCETWDAEFRAAFAMQRRVLRVNAALRHPLIAPVANAIPALSSRDM